AYVSNLNSKAKLLQQQGQYNEAEKIFDEALARCEKRFSKESLQYAILLNNKAMLYQTMGRFDEAIAGIDNSVVVAQKALKETNILKGKKSFESRQFLSNQANVYQAAGKFENAEKIYLSIKSIYENKLQKNTPEYANVLNQLGILYIQMGKL